MKTIDGKVVVLGSQGVGKTSIIVRYVEKTFNHVNPTVGATFFTCKLNLENARIKLQIWDTAGQERYRSMAPMYYRNANAALLVFDLTQYKSFAAVKSWVAELHRNVEDAMVLAVIGNKSDLTKERQVNGEEGRNYATMIGASYHETSVLYDKGVEGVFLSIATSLIRLSSGEEDLTTLKVYDSNSDLNSSEMPLRPSSEENTNIAHGICEKPHTCC